MSLKTENNLDELKRWVGIVDEIKLDLAAKNISTRFMTAIQRLQPVGSNDDGMGRGRPSLRLGNKPIENGWLDSPRIENDGPGARTIEIVSESPHIEFFTLWTGRPWLGTKPGKDIVMRDKLLAFWWMGQAHYMERVRGADRNGFIPAIDFMEAAYRQTEPFIWQQLGNVMRFSLDQNLRRASL